MSLLQDNKAIYRALVDIFDFTKDEFLKLELAKLIGQIAFKFHSGNFRECEIEDFFESFADKYLHLNLGDSVENNQKNIVHVFTTVYDIGGHTRLVENLIRLDKTHTHHVYVTNQGETKVPSDFHGYIMEQNGLFIIDHDLADLDKSESLFKFVLKYPGKIFLHIHPYDVIPSLTFNAHKNLFDIFFVNHADHAFSYGLDVSSFLINIREEAQNISINKRHFTNCSVLPLPLRKVEVEEELRNSLRTKYGITNDEVLGVCIGSGYKFKPNKFYNFFKTIHEILLKNANLKIIIIGLDHELAKKHDIDVIKHPRLSLKGIIENPYEYQVMADIAIDPMPFGSYTALLETACYGAFPVICYNTNPLFDLSKDPALKEMVRMTLSESEYKEHFNFLCSNPQFLAERRETIHQSIKLWHSGAKWLEEYTNILSQKSFKNGTDVEPHSWTSYDDDFANLNPDLIQRERIILSFFYSHAEQFSMIEIVRIVCNLFLLKFHYRDLLAILKRNLLRAKLSKLT